MINMWVVMHAVVGMSHLRAVVLTSTSRGANGRGKCVTAAYVYEIDKGKTTWRTYKCYWAIEPSMSGMEEAWTGFTPTFISASSKLG